MDFRLYTSKILFCITFIMYQAGHTFQYSYHSLGLKLVHGLLSMNLLYIGLTFNTFKKVTKRIF